MTLRCVIGALWEAIAEGWAIAVMAADSSGWSTALEYSSRIFPQEVVLVAVGSGLEGLSASSEELMGSLVLMIDGRSGESISIGSISSGEGGV